jgi:hypothetical protein
MKVTTSQVMLYIQPYIQLDAICFANETDYFFLIFWGWGKGWFFMFVFMLGSNPDPVHTRQVFYH